jgi:hypothetical protein
VPSATGVEAVSRALEGVATAENLDVDVRPLPARG